MDNLFKRKYLVLVLILLLASLGANAYLLLNKNRTISIESRERAALNLPITQSAVCHFETDADATYDINKKIIELGISQNTPPLGISFSDLDTEVPKIVGNVGQQPALVLANDEEKITLLETGPLNYGNVSMFTIYKGSGVAMWSKQVSLLDIPYSLVSMGFCY